MSDRPIIFSAPMVRALLEGRKTQTRRVLNPQPHGGPLPSDHLEEQAIRDWIDVSSGYEWAMVRRLPYAPGDRLYVREAFNAFQFSQDGDEAWPVKIPTLAECKEAEELAHRYGAPQIVFRESDRARKWFAGHKWRPSIHMPRWASRLTLTVTDVRVQRLQDISEDDAVAEGCLDQVNVHCGPMVNCYGPECPTDPVCSCNLHGCWGIREDFRDLWNSLHGPDAWDANPWVVALTFTVQRGNIDQVPA